LKEGKRFDVKPVSAVAADDYDAVIIPGGFSPDYLRRDPATIKLVQDLDKAGKAIAAICHGPWLMISAGVVKGKKLACFFSIKDDVVNAGAAYIDEPVVVDGNIITSRTPDDLPQFCGAITDFVAGR
ncbi:MAG: DJ-1/PfpI/YhbO family deglycase/protease, partial [Bacillota bacterium]